MLGNSLTPDDLHQCQRELEEIEELVRFQFGGSSMLFNHRRLSSMHLMLRPLQSAHPTQ